MRRWFLVSLISAMALVQVAFALRQSLWADEVFSLAMATGHSVEHPANQAVPAVGDFIESATPVSAEGLRAYAEYQPPIAGLGRVLRAVRLSDTSPPLYYVLLHGWTRVAGTSDLTLRLFSILLSLACVPLLVAMGRDLGDERVGWIAGVLFAASPMALYYSSEGRMYSLLWLSVLVAAWATLHLYRGSGGRFASVLWVLASAAGLLTHYYFVFPWTAMVVFLALTPGGDRRLWLLVRFALVLALICPWYAQLPEVFARWRITQDWVKWKSSSYTIGRVLRDTAIRYFTGNGHNLWERHQRFELFALSLFAVTAVARLRRERGRFFTGGWLLVWLWFAAAIAGPVVADVARKSFIAEYPRYASAALPAVCLLGAWWLATLRGRWGIVAVIAVLLSWLPDIASIARQRGRDGQQTRDVARELSAGSKADDLILIHSIPTGGVSVARYLNSPAGVAVWVGQLGQRRIPDSLKKLIEGRRRVLLVKLHTVGEPAVEEDWLKQNAVLTREHRVGAVFVTEFHAMGSSGF